MASKAGAPPPVVQTDPARLTLALFEPLKQLLFADSLPLMKALSALVDPTELDKLASQLYLLAEANGNVEQLLHGGLKHEIDLCPNSIQLFRQNSLATKMCGKFTSNQGVNFLRESIGPVIVNANNANAVYEIDTTRGQPGEDYAANMDHLKALTSAIAEAIFTSIPKLPTEIKKMCQFVQVNAVAKFPDTRYSSVSGFIFLRYIVPAITTPTISGILNSNPRDGPKRGLILVAKVIQLMANDALPKEAFMKDLIVVLENNKERFHQFIDQISSDVSGPPVDPLSQGNDKELAQWRELFGYLNRNMHYLLEATKKDGRAAHAEVLQQVKAILVQMDKNSKAMAAPPTATRGPPNPPTGAPSSPPNSNRNNHSGTLSQAFSAERLAIFSGFWNTPDAASELLNRTIRWQDSLVRSAEICAPDLLVRASKLISSSIKPAEPGKASNPYAIDWHEISLSVEFTEFSNDLAELQRVDLNELKPRADWSHSQKAVATSFWLNIYHILVIHIHILNGPPTTRRQRLKMSSQYQYEIGGLNFSLDDIVDGIFRCNACKALGGAEPTKRFSSEDARTALAFKKFNGRVLCALSFLTEKCPSIRVYYPNTILVQLTLATEEFFEYNVSVDLEKQLIKVPWIFNTNLTTIGLEFGKTGEMWKWIARHTLDQRVTTEISTLLCTGKSDFGVAMTSKYKVEFQEQSHEPRNRRLFVKDPDSIVRNAPVDEYSRLFKYEDVRTYIEVNTTEMPEKEQEMNVLNLTYKWRQPISHPEKVLSQLMQQAQGMCQTYLFEWGAIAGSQEQFRAFVWSITELQRCDPLTLPQEQQVAFWVNLHNILIIHTYVMLGPLGNQNFFERKSFFSKYKYNVNGLTYTIKQIFRGILLNNQKNQFSKNDPRMKYVLGPHFADARILSTLSHLTKATPTIRWYNFGTFESSKTKATESYLRTHVRCDITNFSVVFPHHLKIAFEVDFQRKSDQFLIWAAPYLGADEKLQVETILATRNHHKLAFARVDDTPWPIFDKPL